MQKTTVHFLLFGCLCLAFLSSCQPENGQQNPSALEEVVAVEAENADRIYASLKMALLRRDDQRREYLMQTGDAGFEQTHFVQYQKEKGQHHFREIYNIYQDSTMGQLEVYVSEFFFDPDSLNQFYVQEDYHIVLRGDTAFIQEESFSYMAPWQRKEIEVAGRMHEVFQIEGYSPLHLKGEAPSRDLPSDYLKFWSPDVGTILVFFGAADDDQMFELQEVGYFKNQDLVADLRQKTVKAFR